MKRATNPERAAVYAYGARTDNGNKAEVSEFVMGQMRLANDMRNRLVELEHECDARRVVIEETAVDPSLIVGRDAAAAECESLDEQIQASKVKSRSKDVPPELRAAKKNAVAALRLFRSEIKDQKAETKDATAEARKELADYRNGVIGDVRRDFAARGLHWGTSGATIQDFETSVKNVIRLRRQGEPAKLSFHRFDGTGTVVVQVMRQAGDPRRTPELLAGGASKWRNVVKVPHVEPRIWEAMTKPARKAWARQQSITVRVGSDDSGGPIWETVPVVMHRPLPADCDVCYVQISRRRVANRHSVSVQVVIRDGEIEPCDRPGVAALDLGWRVAGDGSVRVGVIGTTITLPSHPDLVEVSPNTYEVSVPQRILAVFEKADDLKSIREKRANVMRSRVLEVVSPDRREQLGIDTLHLAKDASLSRRLARLYSTLRFEPVDDLAELFVELHAWRTKDMHLWQWEAHSVAQATNARRDLFRRVAAHVCANVGRYVDEDMDLAKLVRVPEAEDGDTHQAERARAIRQRVSPGELRATFRTTAARDGLTVEAIDAAWTTLPHRECGEMFVKADLARSATVTCPGCGARVDQDVNAAWMLLDASGATGAETPGSARRQVELAERDNPESKVG